METFELKGFNYKLEGEISSIDARSFSAQLLLLNDVLIEVNKALKSESRISLNIKSYQPGSFDIYLELASSIGAGPFIALLKPGAIKDLKKVYDTFVELINLKRV